MTDRDPAGILPPQPSLAGTLRRSRPLLLLLALLLHIVVSPQVANSWVGLLFQLGIILAAAGAAVDSRRHGKQTLVLAVPAAILVVSGDLTGHDRIEWAGYLITVCLYLHVIRLMLRRIFLARVVNLDVISLALCAYVLLGMLWVLFYLPLLAIDPAAFTIAPSLADQNPIHTMTYFSYVTLTTLGYGDIVPVAPLARGLAVVEALTGVLFLAVLISRLVGVYSTKRD